MKVAFTTLHCGSILVWLFNVNIDFPAESVNTYPPLILSFCPGRNTHYGSGVTYLSVARYRYNCYRNLV